MTIIPPKLWMCLPCIEAVCRDIPTVLLIRHIDSRALENLYDSRGDYVLFAVAIRGCQVIEWIARSLNIALDVW